MIAAFSMHSALKDKIAAREARIATVGLGYVGLPLALTIGESGFPVTGFDLNSARVAAINRGERVISYFAEDRITIAVAGGRFRASDDRAVLGEADIVLICVPTPLGADREPDLSYVVRAAETVAAELRPGQLIVLESTVWPGATAGVVRPILERGGLKAGETLLVHGANSGIGVTAILMGKAAGARVFATARGSDKAARARTLGADYSLDASAGDWAAAVKGAGPVDVVLDMVGAEYFARNVDVLAADGRLVVIAVLTGANAELNLLNVMLKRLTITGSTLRARDADEKARLARAVEKHVWPWIASGTVRIPIDRAFPLERAGDAHAWLEQGAQFGKVVLTV